MLLPTLLNKINIGTSYTFQKKARYKTPPMIEIENEISNVLDALVLFRRLPELL